MKWKNRYIRYKRIRRRLVRLTLYTSTFLLVLGYLIFKSSWVQTYITGRIASVISGKTNSKITIDEVSFVPFDTFVLKGLLVLDHHQDTLLYSHDFYFDIKDYSLDKYLVELNLLELNNAVLNIKKYEGEVQTNLEILLGYAKSNDTNKVVPNWSIYVEDLALEELAFTFWDENIPLKDEGLVDFKHIGLSSVTADLDNFVYHDGLVSVNSDLLSFTERSGFKLIGLAGNLMMDNQRLVFKDLELETPTSDINGRWEMRYDGFSAFKDYNTKVEMIGVFDETVLDGNDIAYFTPTLKGIDRKIEFQGDIRGTVSSLYADDLQISYGENTEFRGDVSIVGLPDGKNTVISAKIKELESYNADLQSIPLFPFSGKKLLTTPSWMSNLSKMTFTGEFDGVVSNFKASGNFVTNAGDIKANMNFSKDTNQIVLLNGRIHSTEFNLGQTLGNETLGMISLTGELETKAEKGDSRIKFSGDIPRIDFKGYSYSNIEMDGEIRDKVFSGKLDIIDPNLVFDFDGEIDFSKPSLQRYDFVAHLEKANLKAINWMDRDSSAVLSGDINIGITGNNIEDMNGELKLNNIVWQEKGKKYQLDSLKLRSIKQDKREVLILNSDWFEGKIEGKYNLKEVYPTIINVFSKEIPSLVDAYPTPAGYKGNNDFRLMFKLYNYEMIHEIFTPGFSISDNSRFSGRFNDSEKSYVVNFASDSLFFGAKKIEGLRLYSKNQQEKIYLEANCDFAQLFDTVGIQNLGLSATIDQNKLNYTLSYLNKSELDNYGNITGTMDLNNLDKLMLRFKDSEIAYNNKIWRVDTNNLIAISFQNISIDNFRLFSEDQYLQIDGVASTASRDYLKVSMNRFELGTMKYFWDRARIKLEGDATGNFIFRSVFRDPVFTSELDVNRVFLNDQRFGDIELHASFIPDEELIDIELNVSNTSINKPGKTLAINGGYYPFDEGRLNLNASVENIKLKFLEPYFEGVFSDFERGKTSGNLSITGNVKHPIVTGKVRVDQFNLKVDYLNVQYAVNAQEIVFTEDQIIFDDFVLGHNKWAKSSARVNGIVSHTGFKDFKYRMDSVFLSDFYCLNTSEDENSTYYGQAFVNGLVQLRGDGRTNYIGGNVSTVAYKDKFNTGRTELIMPLHQTEELELSEFVTFVNLSDSTSSSKINMEAQYDFSDLQLDFNFKINQDAVVRIVFDPLVGDEIKASGTGTIGMEINSDGKFRMYGDYEVSNGDYYFTLQRIIGRKFNVVPGSKMSWDGDPLNAVMDMHAVYQSKANLLDLVDSNTVVDYNNWKNQFDNKVQVNTDMFLTGSLWKPRIEVGVSLPNGTPEEVNILESNIVGDDEVNRQAFSLLITNQFTSPRNASSSISEAQGVNSGLQVVEGQLNNALSSIWDNVDLGVDYNERNSSAYNDTVQYELRLLAGFQYKKFSVRADYDINSLVGDIQADFRITDNLKAKAYHKTTNDESSGIGSTSLSSTFGLGASYQTSFDSFSELFKKKEDPAPPSNKKKKNEVIPEVKEEKVEEKKEEVQPEEDQEKKEIDEDKSETDVQPEVVDPPNEERNGG